MFKMSGNAARRVRVKICGITNPRDAEDAVELGADALGFNTWRESKRFLDLQKAAVWIRELPPFVAKIAVMVNPTVAEAEAVFNLPFIDAVQFHGGEDETFCAHFAKLGLPFIKAVAVKDAASLENPGRFRTRRILLDACVPGQFGGTGKPVDLELAEKFASQNPNVQLVLSGGLTPQNVADAVRRLRPFAVDAASGIERVPGKKDCGLMRAFILAAQAAGHP